MSPVDYDTYGVITSDSKGTAYSPVLYSDEGEALPPGVTRVPPKFECENSNSTTVVANDDYAENVAKVTEDATGDSLKFDIGAAPIALTSHAKGPHKDGNQNIRYSCPDDDTGVLPW